MHPAFQAILTIVIGVGGCIGYFYFSNLFLDKVLFPTRGENAGRKSIGPLAGADVLHRENCHYSTPVSRRGNPSPVLA